MIRRVSCHKKKTLDGETLYIYTIFEEGVRKKDVQKENEYTKEHQFLTKRRNRFKLIQEKA